MRAPHAGLVRRAAPRALLLLGLAALSAPAAFFACAARPVDAVVLGAVDVDGGVDAIGAEPTLVWPNPVSSANSDPWIAAHHDQIAQMQPQVLFLDFANRFVTETGTMVAAGYDIASTLAPLIEQHVDAFEVASQYQGYKNPSASPFLRYQIARIVDLRDASGSVNSAILPVATSRSGAQAVDYSQLNSQSFAQLIGVADPSHPGGYLSLCSLFEQGIINEVWAMTADPVTSSDPPSVKFDAVSETKQVYDGNDAPVAGSLVCTSATCIDRAIPCGVTVRIMDFNPGRGAGCHLFDTGILWQDYVTSSALPAFAKVAKTFFNFDFDTRFGAPFHSFYDVCGATEPADAGGCIAWASPTEATSGPAASQTFDFSPMSAGCGNVVFPSNATAPSVQTGDTMVLTSCENYGLRNGTNGADLTTPYTNAMAASDYASTPNVADDCGGTQPTYLLASMPGLGTRATSADGTPMRNWWVYLFY